MADMRAVAPCDERPQVTFCKPARHHLPEDAGARIGMKLEGAFMLAIGRRRSPLPRHHEYTPQVSFTRAPDKRRKPEMSLRLRHAMQIELGFRLDLAFAQPLDRRSIQAHGRGNRRSSYRGWS